MNFLFRVNFSRVASTNSPSRYSIPRSITVNEVLVRPRRGKLIPFRRGKKRDESVTFLWSPMKLARDLRSWIPTVSSRVKSPRSVFLRAGNYGAGTSMALATRLTRGKVTDAISALAIDTSPDREYPRNCAKGMLARDRARFERNACRNNRSNVLGWENGNSRFRKACSSNGFWELDN